MHYGKVGPTLSDGSRQLKFTIPLSNSVIKAVGGASLKEPTLEDIDVGSSGFSDIGNGLILIGSIAANLANNAISGSFSGDIIMKIERDGKNPKGWNWSIIETVTHFDNDGKVVGTEDITYTPEQAKAFLKANEAYLMKVGAYDRISEALGL